MDIQLIEDYPIRKNCTVVRGSKKSTLYDFNLKKVYAINCTAGDIIDLCDGEKRVSDIVNILSAKYEEIDTGETIQYILNLKEKGLIELFQNRMAEPNKREDTLNTTLKDYDSFLKMVHCEITNKCNLKCIHCYGKFGYNNFQNDELSTDEWKKVISEAKTIKCEILQFIGGEPLIRKDFLELFNYAYSLDFDWIDIFTNATLVSDAFAEETARKGVEIRFSVYGHIPEIHDEITQVEGSFDLLLEGIKKLRKHNNRLRAEAILNVRNINYKEEMDNFFRKKFDIPIHFGITRPSYVKDFELIPGITTEQYCEFPPSLNKKDEREIYFEPTDFIVRKKWNECFAGRLCIKANGDVIPCIFARDLLIGNIRNKSLVNLYKEDARCIRDNYKIDNVDECKNCELRYSCRDCRPWAYSITGNWHAKNPYCHYKSERGDKVEERSQKKMGKAEYARAM